MNNYIYIHICCINNWKDIFNKLFFNIKESGLYNIITKIKCNFLTKNKEDAYYIKDDKIEIIGIKDDLNSYEPSTLNLLYEHAFLEKFNVLYIHTKGVKHNNTNPCVTDWTHYLSYFNMYKYDICIKNLEEYDTVGVNLQDVPQLHYSGNFWWSKSDYIKKLKRCENSYHSPEFWITEKKIGKYLGLWLSNVNHYICRYDESNYKNKGEILKKLLF